MTVGRHRRERRQTPHGRLLAGLGIVMQVWWDRELGRVIEIFGPTGPWSVRIMGREDRQPWLRTVAVHESGEGIEVIRYDQQEVGPVGSRNG